MKSSIITLFTATAAVSLTLQASAAVSLSLQPNVQTIDLGDSVSMNLVISGLGNHTSPSLGAFGFFNYDLSYDATRLSAVSVTFGSQLDLGLVAGSIKSVDLTTPGAIQIDELSLESAAALNAAQPDSFTLAALTFTGIGIGLGTVSITGGSLSDETGTISLPFTSSAGEIEVRGSSGVPDAGSTAFLLLLATTSLSIVRTASCPRRLRFWRHARRP